MFSKTNANINFNKRIIDFNNGMIFELHNESNSKPFVYKLKPRSETLLKANVLNPGIKEGLVEGKEIIKGVYLSNAVTDSDSDCFKLNTDRHSRLKQLREQLRTDHLNYEEKQSLLYLCEKYNEVFYLEGDTLSSTNT